MEINDIIKANQALQKKLEHFKEQLKSKKAQTENLQQRFKVLSDCGSVLGILVGMM